MAEQAPDRGPQHVQDIERLVQVPPARVAAPVARLTGSAIATAMPVVTVPF